MHEFSHHLAYAVKHARNKMELTQEQVGEMIDADTRTISSIENGRSNTRMTTLYPLVKTLHIDPRDIFYPEANDGSSAKRQLHVLVDDCSESEASTLAPVFEAVLAAMRTNQAFKIEEKKSPSSRK